MTDARRWGARRHPLVDRLPRTLPELLLTAEYGDWRLRAACLSEAGRLARSESLITRTLAPGIRRFPGLRRLVHPTGHFGRYVRGPIGNGLRDRSWPVRVAAALGLGECRSPHALPDLQRLLAGPFRAERVAAAAAILKCGGTLPPIPRGQASLLTGALEVPASVGDSCLSLDVLTALASVHDHVLRQWASLTLEEQPQRTDPRGWAKFMAGARTTELAPTLRAEIDRYDPEGEIEYLRAKPFTPINRANNPRLLGAFATVCEHLRVPLHGRVLDLGGGSAWVSELLGRLGYRLRSTRLRRCSASAPSVSHTQG